MHASTLVLLVTSPLNAFLSYILVHHTHLAFLGAPLSISITYHLSFMLLVAYARWGLGPSQPPNDRRTGRRTSRSSSAGPSPEFLVTPSLSSSSITLAHGQTQGTTSYAESPLPLPKTAGSALDCTLTLRTLLAPAPILAFLGLALPGILMVATEWWAFEIVALAAGRLGRRSLAAQGVVMTADQST